MTTASNDPIIYAIGDIHGYADLLDSLLEQIEWDAEEIPNRPKHAVFVGDYVDRGPNSRGVVARVRTWRPRFPVTHLLGNHESWMIQAHEGADPNEWMRWGGSATLASYRGHAGALADDVAWFKTLKLSKVIASGGTDYLFVHAGVDPTRPLTEQRDDDLMWIREPFLSHEGDYGMIVVHGHTPNGTGYGEVRPNRINVDAGVWLSGRLAAVVLGDGAPRFLYAETR